jgi:hypothetical protein
MREDIVQLKLMLEGGTTLRPRLLVDLLEACDSIKGKRLFLWLSRVVGHSWYQHINISQVDLGKGKRQIIAGGILDVEFMITIPKEMQHAIHKTS